MKSEESIYQEVYVSSRPPPKISYEDNWMNELDSEVETPNESNQNQKPNYQERRDPWVGKMSTKEIEKGTLFDHEDVKHSTKTGRPVCGSESTKSCVLIQKLKKIKQERGDP